MAFDKSLCASRIRAKRAEMDLTQGELGKRIGVNASTVCSWESGDGFTPGADKIYALAELFGCDPAWLMGWK